MRIIFLSIIFFKSSLIYLDMEKNVKIYILGNTQKTKNILVLSKKNLN